MASPIPLPVLSFPVAPRSNRSKMRSRSTAGTPTPLSVTENSHAPRRRRAAIVMTGRCPGLVARRALPTRFWMTRPNCTRSARTRGSSSMTIWASTSSSPCPSRMMIACTTSLQSNPVTSSMAEDERRCSSTVSTSSRMLLAALITWARKDCDFSSSPAPPWRITSSVNPTTAWSGDRRSWTTSAVKAASCRLASSASARRRSRSSKRARWRDSTSASPPNTSCRALAWLLLRRWAAADDGISDLQEVDVAPGGIGAEDVAHAPHRVDEPRSLLLQLPPERTDVDLHEVQVVVLESPDLGEELHLRQHHAGVAGQSGQEGELAVGELDDLPVADGPVGLQVDGQVADRQHAATDAAPSPKHRLHPNEELGHGEGLDDVVVAADLEARQHVFDGRGAGDEQERELAGGPDPACNGDAVDPAAEMQVEERDVGQEVRHRPFNAAAVGLGANVVAGAGEGRR